MKWNENDTEVLTYSAIGTLALAKLSGFTLASVVPFMPIVGIGAIGLGSIYGAYRIATRDEREHKESIENQRETWIEFFEGAGIKNKEGVVPILVEIFETSNGHIYSFIKPLGLAARDFQSKNEAIEEFVNCDKVEFEAKEDFINIITTETKLPKMIPYVQHKPKDTTKLQICFGEDIYGKVMTTFDEANGHLLISGTSGGGKSCATRVALTSLVQNYKPSEVELWIGDFKIVELTPFQHTRLTTRFATEKDDIYQMVLDLQKEMKDRYKNFTEYRANDIRTYNKKVPKKMRIKRIVFFIEEIAEFYQNDNVKDKEQKKYIDEVYEALLKLSQQGRAAGINLWFTLQRPDSKTFPGSIKANIPTRYCLATSDAINSEIILGRGDGSAKDLRGNGHAIIKNAEGKKEIQTYYIPFEELDDQLYPYLTDEGKRLVDRDRNRGI